MPEITSQLDFLRSVSTYKKTDLAALDNVLSSSGRSKTSIDGLIGQITSDRLILAAQHLTHGDSLLQIRSYRSSISRHYYAMYHCTRAVVFGSYRGDDFERHAILPRNLPSDLNDRESWEVLLSEARLLRNQADYDAYPLNDGAWQNDARTLSITASRLISDFEDYALGKGLIS